METIDLKLPTPAAAEEAKSAARALSPLLRKKSPPSIRVTVSGPGSETTVTVPREALELFLELLGHMGCGSSVSVVPIQAELTTQEAAEILNVSRPYLVRLLDEGKIPSRLVGTHRRVRAADLLEYRKADEARRKALLDELTQEAEKHRLGY